MIQEVEAGATQLYIVPHLSTCTCTLFVEIVFYFVIFIFHVTFFLCLYFFIFCRIKLIFYIFYPKIIFILSF